MEQTPEALLAEARSWIGTPYKHQASRKGAGCDCLGLIRGLYRFLHNREPAIPANYAPEWADLNNEDQLLIAARQYLDEVPETSPKPAQVLLFRWAPHYPCKHLGLMSAQDRFIHAYEAVGVVESPLVPMWRNKIAGCFSFFPTD
ncbi:peptidase P60 [Pseudovibrio japonicus]|nr:peptidase P60 [Pseudovibrio japonicus]